MWGMVLERSPPQEVEYIYIYGLYIPKYTYQHNSYQNTHTRKLIPEYSYQNTHARILIPEYSYQKTHTRILIPKYSYQNTHTRILIPE